MSPDGAASLSFEVGPGDTATALGSGDVAVLATPRLLAWCEAATVAALAPSGVGAGQDRTSVGTRVELEHLAATPVGGRVEVRAALAESHERTRRFEVTARGGAGRLVATGRITRVIVDRQRFADRVRPA